MKVVLCAINSRFSQTNPAIRSLVLHAATVLSTESSGTGFQPVIREYTTAQPVDAIARDLFGLAGDLFAFSCSIWNRRSVLDVIAQLRCMLPQTRILVGGPEVSFDAPDILHNQPAIDWIISGEGESPFTRLIQHLLLAENQSASSPTALATASLAEDSLAGIPALSWRDGDRIISNPPDNNPLDLATLPFPYEHDLVILKDRILYYESSRGCPYRCAYCLSAIDHRVRYRPLAQTLDHLDRFIQAGVRLVKLVDRTFNSDPPRARAIWSYLITHYQDQPVSTCFHFEIAADLLTEADVTLLSKAPKGLFQLEIGVQSTDPDTLKRIRRHCDLPVLMQRVRDLKRAGRQHLHVDLIAGLPGESLDQIITTFNQLFSLHADQLQLGFLKLLPGTPILQEIPTCEYRYQPFPPYEVLSSRDLPAAAMCTLHRVEAVLELYANSGLFEWTLPHLCRLFESPYAFFLALADEQEQNGDSSRGLSVNERGSILARLAGESLPPPDNRLIEGLLRLDHYRCGRKDAPSHLNALETTATPSQKARIAELRMMVLPGSRIRVESYPFAVQTLMADGCLKTGEEWLVYDITGPEPVIAATVPASLSED